MSKDSTDDLKPLLLQLLQKTETILADVSGLKADVSTLKAGQTRLEDEMRQVKEVVGITRTREIARLDGRIDQLAMDVALGRKPAAAE